MKTHRLNRLPSLLRIFTAGALVSAAAAMAFVAVKTSTSTSHATSTSGATTSMGRFRALQEALETSLGVTRSGEPDPSDPNAKIAEAIKKIHNGRAQQAYDDRAYPSKWIEAAQQIGAANAASAIAALDPALTGPWQAIGAAGVSADAFVVTESTPATIGTVYSGRATAIAISPTCVSGNCVLFLGAAGGGVWKTPDALAATPTWTEVTAGQVPSNAIGSIVFDPTDSTHKTIYVGTGEPNGSSDSEAGVGLFKSTDGGTTWSLVAGSTAANAPCASNPASLTCPVATGRSIGAIAIDPANKNHIFIGTDVARHGASSVNGGRFTPPGSALIGLYESTNGGGTFSPAKIPSQDSVNPASPNGGDFFRGGCSHVELHRTATATPETEVYASFFDFGIFRRSNTQDGDLLFHQIFGSQFNGNPAASSLFRTEFSLAPNGSNLRVYVGDGGIGNTPESGPADQTGIEAQFYRVDNANVAAATLFTGGTNGGWTQLSSGTNGTPGFGSFNYCTGQCTYDMPVFSPPGSPNIVYIGGASQYGEIDNIGGDVHRSNGRDVVRSQDAGVNFTDMTADATGTGNTPGVALHPDQHALVTAPGKPNTLFIADDGGLWRVNGDTAGFFDMSGQCASRNLPTANDLLDCQHWLSKVPKTITSMNLGLQTLQYQSLSVNVNTANDIIGGTQDNGTHASNPAGPFSPSTWFVTVFGDGGNSGVNIDHPETRMHTFFNQRGASQIEVNFRGTHPNTTSEQAWSWVGDPGSLSGENMSFYIPLIADPNVDGTWFFGAQHVWRTQDNGGNQTFLEANCNQFVSGHGGDIFTGACGDWVPLGKDLTSSSFGKDKTPGPNGYIAATRRAPSDTGTLWVGLRRGRVFVSSNADKPNASVAFFRIDTSSTPERFVSGIAVDPADPNHAFISFSGYNAYATATGTATGHVFDVHYNSSGHTATWTNIDHNLGDEPVTGIVLDPKTGDLFISTDFAVNALTPGSTTWVPASTGLPPVATYGLTFDSVNRVLYAATHGRSAYRLSVP